MVTVSKRVVSQHERGNKELVSRREATKSQSAKERQLCKKTQRVDQQERGIFSGNTAGKMFTYLFIFPCFMLGTII